MSDCENKESVSSDAQEKMDTGEKRDPQPVKVTEDIVVKKADIDEGAGGDAAAKQEEAEEKPKTNGEGSQSEDDEHDEEPEKAEDKKQSEGEESEEENEEEDEEELKPGLLEQPLVRTGKREKKKVERLTMSSPATDKKKVEIQEGSGTKLGDIPRVEFELGRNVADILKVVHRICFNRPGTPHEIRRNLRQFSGYTFKKGSQEYERKTQAIAKLNLSQIKSVCQILDVEKKGLRDEIVERLMEFLMEPKSTGKSVPQKRKRASSGKGRKSTTPGKKGRKPGSGNKEKSKKKKESKSKEDVESDADSDDDEKSEISSAEGSDAEEEKQHEEESEEKDSDSEGEKEEKKPPKKKAKKEEKPKKESKKESPKKATKTPAKEAKKEKKRKSDDEKGDSKKAKKPPNDDELKEVIKKILDGANLEEVTMKTLCKQVYAKYPDFDLTDKKDFIKSTVKQIIR